MVAALTVDAEEQGNGEHVLTALTITASRLVYAPFLSDILRFRTG